MLVVEDDAPVRELWRSALRAAGFAVTAVEDGIDALRRVENQPPDVVVLDLALPRLGGRDVHRELRAHPATRHIPIVIVSGTDISDLDAKDFASVLQKPVEPQEVVVAVDHAVRRAHSPGI